MGLLAKYRTWRDNPERHWRFDNGLRHTNYKGTTFEAKLWSDNGWADGRLLATGRGDSYNEAKEHALRQARSG